MLHSDKTTDQQCKALLYLATAVGKQSLMEQVRSEESREKGKYIFSPTPYQ